ncbi:MAG TPA: hypothetical protein VI078_01435 [bacterium]
MNLGKVFRVISIATVLACLWRPVAQAAGLLGAGSADAAAARVTVVPVDVGVVSAPADPLALGLAPNPADLPAPEAAPIAAPEAGGAYSSLSRTLHATGAVSFSLPYRVSADAGGNVFVSDITANKVFMVSNDGFAVRAFGTGRTGKALGDVPGPEGAAVIGDSLFVASYYNQNITRFQVSTGAAIDSFAIPGAAGPPFGLTAGPDAKLYVTQYSPPTNCAVKAIDPATGALVTSFGSGGVVGGACGASTSPLQFNWPKEAAFDATGNIYVTDANNNRIVRMTSAGAFDRTYPVSGPDGLAIDRANTVFVVDRANGGVRHLDSEGAVLGTYYASYTKVPRAGNFSSAGDLAVVDVPNAQPVVWVSNVDSGAPYVTRFETTSVPLSHNFQQKWGTPGSGNGQFAQPYGVAVDSAENVYVTDFSNNRVQKFDKYGAWLASWGTPGSGDGQFNGPWGIAVDARDRVFVADANNHRIQIFDTSGAFLDTLGSGGTQGGQFTLPAGIAIDRLGYLYVAEFGANNRIQVFSPSSSPDGFVTYASWGGTGTANGQFSSPIGIAVDSAQGLTYNVDYLGRRLQVWTWDGVYVANITPSGLCVLTAPGGVWLDPRGTIYISDWGASNIKQVDQNGNCIGVIGSTGSGDLQFSSPSAGAISPRSGQILVPDVGNDRVQRLGSPNPRNDTVAVFRPGTGTFYFRNSNTTGYADFRAAFGNAAAPARDVPVVGDWNGDGIATIGVFRSSTGEFRLRDANLPGAPHFSFAFGHPGDRPVVGDWDGDGKDGVGVYQPSTGTLYLRNTLASGPADYAVLLGSATDIPVAGDWNGDGQFSPGVYLPAEGRFHLTDKVASGVVGFDYDVAFGAAGDQPFTGDWVNQGSTGLGLIRSSTGYLLLMNGLTGTTPDASIFYGVSGDIGLGGTWGPPPAASTAATIYLPLVRN